MPARVASLLRVTAGEEPASEGGRPDLQVCLGDLFSVAWIELAEALALDDTPLQLEYLRVQNRTSNNGTYIQARRRSLCPVGRADCLDISARASTKHARASIIVPCQSCRGQAWPPAR